MGITAGEAKNPRKSVPKAINGTFWRITIFYALAIFVLGLLIPYTDPRLNLLQDSSDGSQTAFTLAFESFGIDWAAHIMNAVILIAALSAGNSSLYATSRTMMALAEEGKAPKFLGYKTKMGVPIWSVLLSSSLGLISFLGSIPDVGVSVVFFWLTNVTGMSSLVTWVAICMIHIRFRKAYIAQGYDINTLPYRAPFFPYGQYLAIFLGCLVLFGQVCTTIISKDGIDWTTFVAVYVGVPFYFLLYAIYKYRYKTKIVPLMECDFQTGMAKIEEEEIDSPPSTLLGKVGHHLSSIFFSE